MNRPTRLYRVAGICMSMFAPALADVPPAMDRCPSDVPVVISIKNVAAFQKGISTMANTLKVPAEALAGLKKAEDVLKLPGLNADGSAAVAVLALDPQGESSEPPIVVVVPVKDYASFAKALGGAGSGLEEVKFDDNPAFVKDLGGGFAALGPVKASVEQFAGKSGSGKEIEALMGATGASIADASDFVVVANMKHLAPMMKEGVDGFKAQMEMMAGMAGGNQAGFEMMTALADGFVRDATAGILGFKATDAGLTVEAGAQFKEGSEFAGYLNAKGKTSILMGALPQQEFLLAMAFDTSSAGFKKLAKKIVDISKQDPEAAKMMSGMNPLESIDKVDGVAFCMGQTPALMGGLFLNTTMFAKTSDAAGYVKQMKDGFGNINGKSVQGVTYTTSFQSGGAKVGEKPVDVWSMKMAADPSDPAGAQVAQMQMMMFGPGGLGGYMAQTDNGVVITYSKNSELMTKALDSAKSGSGLGADAGVKNVAAHLPADRTFEMYFGVKSILETATGFMGMMGAGPQNFTPPADLPPIGLSGTAQGGGIRLSTFVPTQVMVTFKALSDSMQGGDEMPAEPAAKDKAGQPKF